MRILIYIIPLAYILLTTYKDHKLFRLIFVPLILLSMFASTNYYEKLGFPFRFTLLAIFFFLLAFLIYFYFKEYKETKLSILHNKRQERKEAQDIQDKNPTRKKKIIIEDLRTREKRTYWVSPSIKDRYQNKEKD